MGRWRASSSAAWAAWSSTSTIRSKVVETVVQTAGRHLGGLTVEDGGAGTEGDPAVPAGGDVGDLPDDLEDHLVADDETEVAAVVLVALVGQVDALELQRESGVTAAAACHGPVGRIELIAHCDSFRYWLSQLLVWSRSRCGWSSRALTALMASAG